MKQNISHKPILSLKNVAVSYFRHESSFKKNRYWALKNVSFDLYQGETLGVIGRNGAGKSTLLRLLAGILSPERGEVIRGPHRISLLALQVGFVPYLTGRQNAILSGILLGMRLQEVKGKLDEILDFAELGQFADQPVRTYSSGMMARLGFSVAFQADPDVLLIDEVLGVGDAAFREKSTDAIHKKIKSDKSIVLVSHSPETIQHLCDRVVWVEDGVTCAEGSPAEVLAKYYSSLNLPTDHTG